MVVKVQAEDFDPGGELAALGTGHNDAGAIASFTGLVRDRPDRSLVRLEIEHYPAMTQAAIEDIRDTAMTRWSLIDALVIHRYGVLEPGARIMMVATAAAHRKAAFDSAEFLMDYLKSRAPFWKKEVTTTSADWVASDQRDEESLDRW